LRLSLTRLCSSSPTIRLVVFAIGRLFLICRSFALESHG
jgi:hypothetical protein